MSTSTSQITDPRALLVVTDGLGYDPVAVSKLADEVIATLDEPIRHAIEEYAKDASADDGQRKLIARLSVVPNPVEGIDANVSWHDALEMLARINAVKGQLHRDGLTESIAETRRTIGRENRYIPWIGDIPEWTRKVNTHLTVPTRAAGKWVGYEDVDPEVQGNSETGHQQIGNLSLAPQIPLQISQSILDGTFFHNRKLRSAIETACATGNNINFCFLLSGVRGSDGRVHSAWNHLEAFLELLFEHIGLPPERVRMQAILDGRDAPAHGSLEMDGIPGGYLGHLERLLHRFDAIDSLAWVIGRSIAMDRDYREVNAKQDFELLTGAHGRLVADLDEVRHIVTDTHRRGFTDADVPSMLLTRGNNGPARVEVGDAFINLNFRSDRQRCKTASLSGARAYLEREASVRGRTWKFDWFRDDMKLQMCTIAEYDAEFEQHYGVEVAYPISPHRRNFLSHWDALSNSNDRYLLVAESVKALHMGYFVRGRREAEEASQGEDRVIIPSDGAAQGVMFDSDFYLNPPMKTYEIAQHVSDAMKQGEHRLIMCNLAAPDMIGHLLPNRYEAAIEAYRATVETLHELSETARRCGYSMVVTSDHGNIENDAPTHTINPVLTTIITPSGHAAPRDVSAPFIANLFDMSHTLARLIGIDAERLLAITDTVRAELADEFIGKSIIR